MPRPRKPWSISSERANGVYWYYRLEGWANYQSTGIKVERRNGRPTQKSRQEAEKFASDRWHNAALVAARGETVGEVLAEAYLWGRCEYIEQILTDSDGTGYQKVTAEQNRGRIERYVLNDEIARQPADSPPIVWQRWKRRVLERGKNPPEGARAFGPRTVNMTLDHVRAYFQWLVDTGRMKQNPLASVRAIRVQDEGTGIFNADEVRAMFSHPEWWGYPGRPKMQKKHGDFAFAAPVLIASTLSRPFEIFKVRWRDIDLAEKTITFPSTKRVRGNSAGRGRTVPLTELAARVVEGLERGGPDDLLFGGRTRDFYDQRFEAMMKASQFDRTDWDGHKRTPYALKHSMYTLLIDEGADPVAVAELAGHSRRSIGARSLTRTQEHYKRKSIERLRATTKIIDAIMVENTVENVLLFEKGETV